MKYLEHTLATPAENLACDEALLDWCENDKGPELLRIWEPREFFVVLGYGNRVGLEVDWEACQRQGIPVLRRSSGGGAVLQGPGSLSYALILKIDGRRPVHTISAANHYVMERHLEALGRLAGGPLSVRGDTDLVLANRKFSGNAQRRRRHGLLFHGTFLYAFDFDLMEVLLPRPSRQPDYRKNRGHSEFLRNFPASRDQIVESLRRCWEAEDHLTELPADRIASLVRERYGARDWNLKLI